MTGLERLRNITDGLDRGPWLGDVTSALYGTARQIESEQADDHEIAEWVRDNGGIENIQDELANDRGLVMVVRDALWSDGKVPCCENGNEQIADELNKRLMPHGMEWPRFEDGEPLNIFDEFIDHSGKERTVKAFYISKQSQCGIEDEIGFMTFLDDGERIKRPEQDPIEADGLPIKKGETVYDKNSGDRLIVGAIEDCGYTITCRYADLEDSAIPTHGSWSPCDLTHSAPVIATDGKPLSGGETVWGVNGATYRVTDVHDGKVFARHIGGSFGAEVESAGGSGLYRLRAEQLTHERPDSWERLEADMGDDMAQQQCGPVSPEVATAHAAEFVRRAKALAERERE